MPIELRQTVVLYTRTNQYSPSRTMRYMIDGPRNLDVTALNKVNEKTTTSKTNALIQAVARPVQHQSVTEVNIGYQYCTNRSHCKRTRAHFELVSHKSWWGRTYSSLETGRRHPFTGRSDIVTVYLIEFWTWKMATWGYWALGELWTWGFYKC